MENKESSPPPNGQTNPNRWSHFDTMTNIANARFYMHNDRIEEAVVAYSEILDSVNGNKPLAREISLERASAYIELGNFDEAIADLQSVVEFSISVSDEKRQDLKFVLERLLAQVPRENIPKDFVFDITPEEMTEVEPVSEAGLLEETLLPPRYVPVPSVILPRIQPVGT